MSEIYEKYDALGMAELVKSKQVHPKELLEEAIQRIETINPSLNAVIHKMYEQAEWTIENSNIDGRFAGIPMLLKDITQEIAGEPITSGSKALKSYRAKKDSEYVRRVRKTGAVFLGQTNTPEFALMGITEPTYYGPTRNPWNTEYTPGGSSGGSGAAVASGMVPLAGANDGGGSIRIPGAYCGLFGLKPTRGRTPAGPLFGRHWQGASSDHVLTRSVRDSAAMLDEICGIEKGAAFYAPHYNGSFLECVTQSLDQKLTVAYTTESPLGTDVHPECKDAVLNTVKFFEKMGHIVEQKGAPVDGRKIATSYLTMYFGEVAASLSSLEELLGRKAKSSDVEPQTWLLGLLGRATTAEEFVLSLRVWDEAAFAMEHFHETYDLYITPTTAFPPAKIGEFEPRPMEKLLINTIGTIGLGGLLKKAGMVDQIAEQSLMRTPFTQLANLTGQPAMTVPLHMTKAGLPCGVQLMAARGREDLLYQLAGELEQTELWIDVSKIKDKGQLL